MRRNEFIRFVDLDGRPHAARRSAIVAAGTFGPRFASSGDVVAPGGGWVEIGTQGIRVPTTDVEALRVIRLVAPGRGRK